MTALDRLATSNPNLAMKPLYLWITALASLALFPSCGHGHEHSVEEHAEGAAGHAEGESDDDEAGHDGDEEDHHEEDPLGSMLLGDFEVELAQGHGAVTAGKDAHLVVKLPYSDEGVSIVRAWIGSADRLGSYVGLGEYAPSHDDYNVHATAPDPLPANPKWWVELERPDGTKLVGSVQPLMK